MAHTPSMSSAGLRTHVGRASLVETRTVDAPAITRGVLAGFAIVAACAVGIVCHQAFGLGGAGSDGFFGYWLYNVQMLGAAALIGWRARAFRGERLAWSLIATGLGLYALGDFVWTSFFSESDALVTVADAFYLAMYPFTVAGIALLVRRRIAKFEMSRWIDGVAAALIVATPGVVLVLEPTIRASGGNVIDIVVTIAYPTLDIMMLGAAIGVNALLGWRPGAAWLMLTAGLAMFVVADSMYAVQNLRGQYVEGQFDYIWNLATLMLAASAWTRPLLHARVAQWGWRAIALPVMCQAVPMLNLAFSIDSAGESVLTIAVMAIVMVQLVVTRPRRPEHLAASAPAERQAESNEAEPADLLDAA